MNKKDIAEFNQGSVISLFGNIKYNAQKMGRPRGVFHTIISSDYEVYVSEYSNECICSVVINGDTVNPQIETKTFIESVLEAYKVVYSSN